MTKEEKWYRDYFGLSADEVPELGTGDQQSIKMLKDYANKHLLKQCNVMRRFRVNMLHRGKERWKYCRTIERAKKLQQEATAGGLYSIIYEKGDKGYVAWNGV